MVLGDPCERVVVTQKGHNSWGRTTVLEGPQSEFAGRSRGVGQKCGYNCTFQPQWGTSALELLTNIILEVTQKDQKTPAETGQNHTWVQGPAGGSLVGEADLAGGVDSAHVA